MPVRVSVISVSIRPKGLDIIQKCLAEQTFPFEDFEWLTELSVPPKCNYDLNKAYNRALRRAKGELVVSLQDYIKVTPQYLEKFWKAYQENPKTFFTAPVGKTDKEDFTGNIRWDWRAYKDAKPDWKCWEIDSGAAPRQALFDIGGFDEELDGKWSCDNINVGFRADKSGYRFMNLFDNPAVAYDHDAFIPNPFRKVGKDFEKVVQFNAQRMREIEMGELKINYLY
jgi:hypothetical protein